MTPARQRAYRASAYCIGATTLGIGRRDRRLDTLLARMATRDAVLLTACNPRSRRMPPGWNAAAMRRLRQHLRGRRTMAGESGSGRWHEAQILVACPHAWGLRLARHFRQNAVVTLRRSQPPRLVSCTA